MKNDRFARFGWGVLAYTVFVIVFGAFVRASLSGDGCGAHWPTCDGGILPIGAGAKKIIEFTHRVTSGLLLPILAAFWLWARSVFPMGHGSRKASGLAVLFTVISALIGAALVLFRWVTTDQSAGRALTMPLHLINTYFLVGALFLAVFWASGHEGSWRKRGSIGWGLNGGLIALLLLGATGGISALGKTAFGAELAAATDLAQRINMHLAPDANPILRGGILHPLIATSVGLYLLWMSGLVNHALNLAKVRALSRWVVGLYAAQFVLGAVNLLVGAPIGLQLLHLVVALLNWIAMVSLIGTVAMTPAPVEEEAQEPVQVKPMTGRAMIGQYIALTKPRVISLLLFTTLTAMFIAARGWPGGWLLFAVAVGGYMAAGAANAFNMVLEPDLDLAMGRTANRPTVTHKISRRNATIFAFVTAIGSFVLLSLAANVLCASLAIAGLLFYVFVYTLLLKRRTWHNIVIGGAAGAFPPLVGWSAVTGELNPFAWTLFAIIFVWTPVHFWALALLLKDDYARAGVPMLPVVRGEKVTVIQIGIYTLLTAIVSVIPLFGRHVGVFYLAGSVLLNIVLVAQSYQLLKHNDRAHAKSVFKYSMIYLALLFLIAAIDRAGWA